MNNPGIRLKNKKKKASKSSSVGIIGDYATIEELIEVKKAQLIKTVPMLDLSVLVQHLGKNQTPC
ncbi:hypothetical protein [Dyadobacter jiangsuensis]|uniref:Uncharacterized protein n=1 Tax=Dyadobacter jiangsuensis TaxID=1591085 RepID=A0A2P8FU41_9BACT|nr:hypothetical protein [Dyadobacter jiangsuensis]PSL25239.1 hypothetical protein CLV60_112158 [Dyadobacter jiangsuensis]